jgi:hypothetical protein
MKNYESLRKKKEIIRDEVYQLVETITTKYNEEVGDIGEIDPITKVGLERDFNAIVQDHLSNFYIFLIYLCVSSNSNPSQARRNH